MDDDQTIHAIIEEMLKYLGYSTIHALDGKEAIEMYIEMLKEEGRIIPKDQIETKVCILNI